MPGWIPFADGREKSQMTRAGRLASLAVQCPDGGPVKVWAWKAEVIVGKRLLARHGQAATGDEARLKAIEEGRILLLLAATLGADPEN